MQGESIMISNGLKKGIKGILMLSWALLMAVSPVDARADTADQQELKTGETIAPIIVTAQKRQENVQDVPMSMSVLSDVDLEDAGIGNVSDMVAFIPNLFLKASSAENELIIRGISSFNTAIYSPAGMYVDGVNIPLHYMYNMELLDLERVEILRGPQGTLYGRNSESGVVNLVTRQPDDQFNGKILTEYASYNSWRLGVNVSGPVARDLFIGVAAQGKISDGYIENLYNGDDASGKKDRKDGRFTLRWTPADQWDLSYIADAMATNDQQNSYRYRNTAFASNPYEIRHNLTDEYSDQEGWGQTLKAQFKGYTFDLVSITGLRRYSHDYNTDMDCTDDAGPYFAWGGSPSSYDVSHMSEEFRISSPEKNQRFEWLAGLYSFKEAIDIMNEKPLWGMKANTDIDIEGVAVFGQATFTFMEKIHLTAGLRLDHQRLNGTMTGTGSYGIIDQDQDLDYTEWLPKLCLSYDVTQDAMAYISMSKGYMVGGYNYGYMPSSKEAFTYDSEYTWNYEAGIKAAWLDNKLVASLSVFNIEIKDKQVVQWSMTQGSKIDNAAQAYSRGIELELQARIRQGLDLFAGFGYARSKFNDWQPLQSDGTIYNFKGNDLPNAPRCTYHLGASYRHYSGLFARADLLGTGRFYGDAKNSVKQSSYQIVNLRTGYEAEHWGIALWAKNLFDEAYVTALYDNSSMGLGDLVQDGEPRMIGLTLTYRF